MVSNLQPSFDTSPDDALDVSELQDMVVELQGRLELMRAEKQEAVQKAGVAADREPGQLKQTIVAMRDEMDSMLAAKQAAVDENDRLKQTVHALREQMAKAAGF